MTNIFANQTTKDLEQDVDYLGSGGVVETGVYSGVVSVAYVGKSRSSESQSVTVHIKLNESGIEFRETHWVTNKKNENFYVDKNNKKHAIPGYSMIDNLCLLTRNGRKSY